MEFDGALDDGKPSLFELLSEQQLSGLLPPTLRYLLTLAAERHPRHLLRVLNSFDELYALAALLVEGHHLRTRGGSFTEHFYGLKRERVPVAAPSLPLAAAAAPGPARDALRLSGRADVLRGLAVLVGFPYLKRKLDEAHERDAPRALLGAGYNRLPARPSPRDRAAHFWRWFLRRAYPGLSAAWGLAALAFNLAYLFDGARSHSPLLWLVGQRVRRMTAADYAAIEAAAAGGKAGPGGRGGGSALSSPRGVARAALGGLSVLLPAGIFALKFLEWWHASDFARQLSRRADESLDLPPPVVSGLDGAAERKRRAAAAAAEGEEEKGEEEEEEEEAALVGRAPIATPSMLPVLTVPAPADSSLCPICGDDVATATACQTGVVYCYGCIHRWVGGEHPRQEAFMAAAGGRAGRWESGAGRCAVTGRRVLGGTEGLRRIMV